MSKSPIVVSYLRFSSKRQAKGSSTARQTDYIEDEDTIHRLEEQFCKARGLTLDTRMRFADKGRSARPGRHRGVSGWAAAGWLTCSTAKRNGSWRLSILPSWRPT